MLRLPVSGLAVELRPPGGAEELLLWEARDLDRAFALDLVRRLATAAAPDELSVHDFEALLLHLRRLVLGDGIVGDAFCGCAERIDVSFSIAAFLAHRAPRRP